MGTTNYWFAFIIIFDHGSTVEELSHLMFWAVRLQAKFKSMFCEYLNFHYSSFFQMTSIKSTYYLIGTFS
jgi:hypothetical protein